MECDYLSLASVSHTTGVGPSTAVDGKARIVHQSMKQAASEMLSARRQLKVDFDIARRFRTTDQHSPGGGWLERIRLILDGFRRSTRTRRCSRHSFLNPLQWYATCMHQLLTVELNDAF